MTNTYTTNNQTDVANLVEGHLVLQRLDDQHFEWCVRDAVRDMEREVILDHTDEEHISRRGEDIVNSMSSYTWSELLTHYELHPLDSSTDGGVDTVTSMIYHYAFRDEIRARIRQQPWRALTAPVEVLLP